MANQDALRELQARLASQLEAAQTQDRGRAWLAVECAGAGFLLPLNEAGEIFPFRSCVVVPHTRRWFLGVANLRGQLQGVVDLARFLALDASAGPADAGWLIALNPRFDVNAALRVDRLAGLRREAQLQPVGSLSESGPGTPRPRFAGALYRDEASAMPWQEIRLVELAADGHFLDIAGGL